jgi:predicted transcriptional regulator
VTFEETELGNYRGKLDIIADILQVVSKNAKKTQIMYQANLNYRILMRYLKEITEASLISFQTAEQYYVLTEKGQAFLEVYRDYANTNKSIKKWLNAVDAKKKCLESFVPDK